jgi:hypothetical protein
MKIFPKIVIIVLILLFVIIFIQNYIHIQKTPTIETFETEEFVADLDPNSQLGNFLSCYFYKLGLAFLHGKNYKTNIPRNNETNIFTNYLPDMVDFDPNIQAEFMAAGITDGSLINELNEIDGHCVSAWNVLTKEREQFWTILKPVINKLLKEALEKANLKKEIDAPVIHYRCSDVPMQRLEYYHFQKYEYFKNALQQIEEKTNQKYDKVYICYCNTHISKEKNQTACDKYSESLVNYLNELGYEAILKCNKIDEDFATMFYAPGLIGTSGSFSFMAGYFSDGVFISSAYDERKDRQCKDCDDRIQSNYVVKHAEIPDYYDTTAVIKLLSSPL